MSRPTPSQVAGGLWHLNIDDLFGPTGEQTRLGGPGPFVINLSASSAPINIPATPLAGCPQAHVYQIQRYEDGRVRYRLRLGAFYTEEDMDPILHHVRETYPSALTATAGPDDLFAIETLSAKAEARRRPVAAKLRAADVAEVAIRPVPASPPIIATAAPEVSPPTVSQSEDVNSLAHLVNSITLLTERLNQSQPIPRAPRVAPSIPTLELPVSATPAAVAMATESSGRATPAAEPEETFVLALVEDTPVVTMSATDAPASGTQADSPGIEVAPSPIASANTPIPAAAPANKSPPIPAAPKPAPPAPRLPLFAFVRQALRRMPQSRTAGAECTPAQVARAAPQVLSTAPAAKSVITHAPSAATPVSPAKPALSGSPIKAAAATPEIASTQTVRALTQQELSDQSSLRWFVVELATADNEFLPESIPQLDIYSAYRLYTVNTFDQGREVHSLRLGFFGDEIAAKTVAGYVDGYYEKPVVKRISIAERRRFEERGVEARKDVGATGKYAVIEITDELVVRDRRLQGLPS